MSSDNKTLADVQPGGRVRLGDQAERAKFEAWVKNHVSSLARAADGDYASNFTHALWSAWQAALSAQPSPGGQDALFTEELGELRRLVPSVNQKQALDAAIAALAARQPVGEPITVEAVAEIFNHPEYGLSINWLLENGIGELQVGDVLMVSDRAITDEDGSGEVYTAPPAQAVDLGQIIDQIAQQWDGCSYDAVGETIDVGQAIRAAGKRLANTDSQAVGNG
ncbi:hypothetical protein [Stenotrophomonas maltophilia]|uniref:hypothetical protein n=1 Tax=Stenotrophomonas maltophilia TaxID=40324 RepID=UPI001660DAA5|nr:hypothetical protein [Stenotrophomonas maltophilia]